ncbi:armadillo-type protein, partial [Jimgerdemannia flammicorona]
IGNIPTTTTPSALHNLFSPYGAIESARVLTHKNCGFVNFERLEDATRAKKALQNKEALGPGTGAVRIGFAKVPPKPTPSPSPSMTTESSSLLEPLGGRKRFPAPTPTPANIPVDANSAAAAAYHTNMMMMMMVGMGGGGTGMSERQMMMQEFGADPDDGVIIDETRSPISYYASIPPIPEPNPNRRLDASRLREIRKRLDSGHATTKEVEGIATECMDECVELCSGDFSTICVFANRLLDYIGNTVIQKLFERCNENTKVRMLEKIAPYLAAIGVHKNGTWAAQKIIDCAKTPTQIHLITTHLKPYIPPLLLDQFGNYVVQCCLRLGASRNQFIFDAMVDRCWDVAQGRFGARAMRASLESQYVTKRQQKYVAVAIVQNALLLSTNPNGALLLTWLLDTSALAGRYRVLAPRVSPHLAHLCTHKLASLTILKIINQRQEPNARDLILSALFYSTNDQVLEEVLMDQVHGVGVVQKVLVSPYVETYEKQRIAERVKSVLTKLKVQQVQGYKRLLEELSAVLGDSTSATLAQTSQVPQGLQPSFTGVIHQDYASTALHPGYYATHQPSINNGASEATNGLTEQQNDVTAGGTSPSTTTSTSATSQAPQHYYPHPTHAYPYPAGVPGSPFQPHLMMHPQALAAAAAMANMYATHPMFNPAGYPYFPIVNGNPNPQLAAALIGQSQQVNQPATNQPQPPRQPSPLPQQQTETDTEAPVSANAEQ